MVAVVFSRLSLMFYGRKTSTKMEGRKLVLKPISLAFAPIFHIPEQNQLDLCGVSMTYNTHLYPTYLQNFNLYLSGFQVNCLSCLASSMFQTSASPLLHIDTSYIILCIHVKC